MDKYLTVHAAIKQLWENNLNRNAIRPLSALTILSRQDVIDLPSSIPNRYNRQKHNDQLLNDKSSNAITETRSSRGVRTSDAARCLHLKSGDNDRVEHISHLLKEKYQRNIDWVILFICILLAYVYFYNKM